MMRSSYKQEDVTILLKDISGLVEPQSTEEREKKIQAGAHYSEMLPLEYAPSSAYMGAYQAALSAFGRETAEAVAVVAEKIVAEKGDGVVLVSLARAGIPIGILIKHYIMRRFQIDVPHYAISIIRGRGIDRNAINYILQRHSPRSIQFVDGWIGKGAILGELEKDTAEFEGVSAKLAVAADPANVTDLCGTHEDILIPSSCLNATVSGLVSRTFLRTDLIGPQDFHGAAYYQSMEGQDLSQHFLDAIEARFPQAAPPEEPCRLEGRGITEVESIAHRLSISDINLIKPGIGEATRVLLRRVPWKILVREGDLDNPRLVHLLRLAEEKDVPVESWPLHNYIACGVIKNLKDI